MVSFLLEPLANGFMQRGLAAGLLVVSVAINLWGVVWSRMLGW